MRYAAVLSLALLLLQEFAAATAPLEELVVLGTRSKAPMIAVPFAVHRVDERAIRSDLYRTLPQALSRIPGVLVQETSAGQGSPFIRGFTGFRNLFLIDGVRLNNSVMRDGPNQYWATVDVHSLGHLEVLSGSAGALYGTDAIGGTVNAVSREIGAGTDVFLRAASAERSAILRVQHDQPLNGGAAVSFGFTGKTFGDLDGGSAVGRQPGIGYDELGFDAKADLSLTEAWNLTLAHQQVQQNNVPRTHRTVAAVPWEGTTVGTDLARELDQERRLSYARLEGEPAAGWLDEAAFTLSWANTQEVRDRLRSGGRREFQGFEVDTLGLTAQFVSPSPLGRLTWGSEYYLDDVSSFSSRNPVQGPVADDASYGLFDLYVQDRIATAMGLEITLGLRYTRSHAQADRVLEPDTGGVLAIDDANESTVGSLRLRYDLIADRLALFAGISQGFRAPNLSDLTRFDTARTDEFEVPAPGLTPERFVTHDLGLKWSGTRSFGTATLFYTTVNDLIIRFPTGRTVQGDAEITKGNAGDGYVAGLELDGGLSLGRGWSARGALTFMDGEISTFPTSAPELVDEPIDRLMPFTANVRLRYEATVAPLWAEFEIVHGALADALSTRDRSDTSRIPPGGTPAYTALHLRGGWSFASGSRLVVAVNNLLDEDYRVHGSGTNMPGRNLILSLETTF